MKRILAACLLVLVLLLAGHAAVDALRHSRTQPPGKRYAVDGHNMRLNCTGTGSPTILLDAGLGNDGTIWSGVQPVLAKTTRVCSYDRAGFGWSDPLPPPRDADHIAAELHELLTAARIDGPIVLMGHSIAAVYLRDYATRYPAQVAGLIFVDGSTPWQNRDPSFRSSDPRRPWPRFKLLLERTAGHLGFPGIGAVAAEMASFDQSGTETIHAAPYGSLPILIFSQDQAPDTTWSRMQEDLKKLSTHSRRIVAKGSGHSIQLDRPELLEREVPVFIEQIRSAAPSSANGSTRME